MAQANAEPVLIISFIKEEGFKRTLKCGEGVSLDPNWKIVPLNTRNSYTIRSPFSDIPMSTSMLSSLIRKFLYSTNCLDLGGQLVA